MEENNLYEYEINRDKFMKFITGKSINDALNKAQIECAELFAHSDVISIKLIERDIK